MAKSNYETEVKIRVPDLAAVARRLSELQFRILHERVDERNIIYDTDEGALRGRGELIRLRRVGDRTVLTYKGVSRPGVHKSREECEVEISDFDTFQHILARLGFSPRFRYDKFRTEYTDDTGVVTLDETPIGSYLELEGEPDWIDRRAADLGYGPAQYLTASYAALYADFCREQGQPFGHMVFPETEPSGG